MKRNKFENAIEILGNIENIDLCSLGLDYNSDYALFVLGKYEAYDIAISAIKKEIEVPVSNASMFNRCPNCQNSFKKEQQGIKRCSECGQKLIWNERED